MPLYRVIYNLWDIEQKRVEDLKISRVFIFFQKFSFLNLDIFSFTPTVDNIFSKILKVGHFLDPLPTGMPTDCENLQGVKFFS